MLPRLAPCLPLETPRVVYRGRPGAGYPLPWAVYRWIRGEPYDDGLVADEREAAHDLAAFVRALRAVPLDGSEVRAGRRPLPALDRQTREHIAALGQHFELAEVEAAWTRALEAPLWDGAPTWIHADLLRPNLLVRDGRLAAVLDFGGTGAGDPATDLVAAWAVFGPHGRAAYREALEPDDGAWERGRGIALHQAAAIVPYYAETNPVFAALGRRTIEQVLLS